MTIENKPQPINEMREINGVPTMVVHDDFRVEELEHLLDNPRITKETVRLTSLPSFIDYVGCYKDGRTAMSIDRGDWRAIIDYHTPETAEWGVHRVLYNPKHSSAWDEWRKHSNTGLSQTEFAQFIEDHIDDIEAPNGADLLSTILDFKLVKKAVFSSATHLQTGEFQLTYSEENQKGTVELPETLTVAIPVYEGGDVFAFDVSLSYRLREGELKLYLRRKHVDKVLNHAVDAMRNSVAAALPEVPIYDGVIG